MKISIQRSILTFILLFSQCKKEDTSRNITLYDKPLETIKQYTKGEWKCHYSKGGFVANLVQPYTDYYWTINPTAIKIIKDRVTIADAGISWIKELGTYTNGTSTYTLNFNDKSNVPWAYVVDRIKNDTLIVHDNSSDAYFYYLTKL